MITKNTTIGEVMRMSRDAAPIFMSYGMFCLYCPHGAMESIEDACKGHGTDADALLRDLNAFFADKAAKEAANK